MLLLWVKVLFLAKKNAIFCKKMLTLAKLKRSWCYKVNFLNLHIGVYFCTRFQVSSIILTSFRQAGEGGLQTTKKPPKLGLISKANAKHLNIFEIIFSWKWLTFIVFAVSIIHLSPRKGAWYGFNVPNRYRKTKPNRMNDTFPFK